MGPDGHRPESPWASAAVLVVRHAMRNALRATGLGLLLLACGETSSPPESTSSAPPPAEVPAPPEAPPASEAPPPPAGAERRPAPTEPRTLGEPTVYVADVGGLVRHGDVLVRFGNGPTIVFGHPDRTRCAVTMEESENVLPAGAWRSLTVTASALAPTDAEYCAALAGSYSSGHPSDPTAGGPPPPPSFEGSECWLRPQITSDGDAMCASFAAVPDPASPDVPATLTAALYEGSCCVGAPRGTRVAPPGARGFLLSSDGATLVAAVHDAMVSSAEIAANPTLFQVLAADATTELRLNDLFAGDPVLTAGTSFGVQVRLEGSELVVRTAGGAEHRHAL